MNYYLEKGSVILKHDSNQLISVRNDVKLRTYVINKNKQIMLWHTTQQFPLYQKT